MKFVFRIGIFLVALTFFVLVLMIGRDGFDTMKYSSELPRPLLQFGAISRNVLKQKDLTSGNEKVVNIELNRTILLVGNNADTLSNVIRIDTNKEENQTIVLAVVVCGDRNNEALVMLKSAATLSTGRKLHLIIVADQSLHGFFHLKLSSWPTSILKRISYKIYPITFPVEKDADEWRKLFKPCASQRLFLPTILDDVDSLIYVDTDVVFLRPLSDLWNFFHKMNSSQMAAMTPEHEDYATGWYNRFARHPYYKPLGVNSGVMLMNLTRMRAFKWQKKILPIYKQYKYNITWGDQDIINIIFHYHPDKLYVYPCEWNFRSDHCMYVSVCKTAERNGIAVLHGSRGVFHNDKQPAFKSVYDAYDNYTLGDNFHSGLIIPMQEALLKTLDTSCGKLYVIYLKSLKKYIFESLYS